ncbi:MAG: NYN domain-containing protein [Anaerolineales bacterium]
MPYLIDGHNLIGAFPGMALSDPEDERKLLEVLEDFGRSSRRKLVVYFDQGRPGMGSPVISGRMVKAHFIPPPRRADDGILDFLRARKDARHFTVVSSDSEIRTKARRAGAKVVSSGEFARQVVDSIHDRKKENQPEAMVALEEWLRMFDG